MCMEASWNRWIHLESKEREMLDFAASYSNKKINQNSTFKIEHLMLLCYEGSIHLRLHSFFLQATYKADNTFLTINCSLQRRLSHRNCKIWQRPTPYLAYW